RVLRVLVSSPPLRSSDLDIYLLEGLDLGVTALRHGAPQATHQILVAQRVRSRTEEQLIQRHGGRRQQRVHGATWQLRVCRAGRPDRKSTRLNSSHVSNSY